MKHSGVEEAMSIVFTNHDDARRHVVPRRVTIEVISAKHEQHRRARSSCPAMVGANTKGEMDMRKVTTIEGSANLRVGHCHRRAYSLTSCGRKCRCLHMLCLQCFHRHRCL